MAKQWVTSRKVFTVHLVQRNHLRLFSYGKTLNSDVYLQQFERLKLAIDQKRPDLPTGEEFCSIKTTSGHTHL